MAPGHRHPEVVRAENDRCHVPRVGVAVLDSPEGFFTTAVDLDGRIREAAQVFDAGLDGEAVTIDPAVAPGLEALGATPRRYLIPAGLAPDLEMAVRAGFTDPDGRISALQGGHREIGLGGNPEYGPDRLANGGTSADRLAGDLEVPGISQ